MNLMPIGAARVDEVAGLLWEAAAHEDLTPDEILSCCYEQGGVVMASADTDAVIAVGLGRDIDGELIASIRLVVVSPARQRQELAERRIRAKRIFLDETFRKISGRPGTGFGADYRCERPAANAASGHQD